jgi:ABC-type multidrug transport system fused ATPase/permease subunit
MKKGRPDYPNKSFIRDLWYFLKKEKRAFILLTSLLVVVSILSLLPALIISKIVNFFADYSNQSPTTFYWYLGALLAVGLIGTILRLGTKHYFMTLTSKLERETKVESFQKIMEGDLVWHDKENTGNKMQRINEGSSSISKFMDFYMNQGVDLVVTLIGIIVIFALIDMKYAIVGIAFFVSYMIAEIIMNKKLSEKQLALQIAKEKSSGKTYEFSSNIFTVKSVGLEKSLKKLVNSQENAVLEAKLARRRISTIKWIILGLISTLFYSLFILIAGRDILAGILSIGAIVIYIDYIGRMRNSLSNISSNFEKLIEVKYSLYRLMQIYSSIPEVKEENTQDLKGWTNIHVNNLVFKYKEEEVLDDFSFNLKKGSKIGVVGKSGSGKSTLFKMLLKLYLPQKGMISFDATPITEITKDSLTKEISIVPQETELFNMSFKDNVTLSVQEKIDYQRYLRAIEVSQCKPVIAKLKNKDDTLIGEKGVRLSGGEKQRLGIARAIYKDSEIIILDEATSNLDYVTERKIQDALNRKLKNKTLVISAHRLSTLRNMDNIIVIEGGRIVEQGTYEELLKKKGEFYKIWKKQSAEKI